MENHKERIICPNCGSIQEAIVEHKIPFWSYVHECNKCGYVIMESEWQPVKKILIFHLKKVWFDKIKAGEKTHEYRRVESWVEQLANYFINEKRGRGFRIDAEVGKKFFILKPKLHNDGLIELCCGYPTRKEKEKWLVAKIKCISANVPGLETDLKIDEPVFDISFDLLTKEV